MSEKADKRVVPPFDVVMKSALAITCPVCKADFNQPCIDVSSRLSYNNKYHYVRGVTVAQPSGLQGKGQGYR